jgi:hypothetical protein
MRSADSLTTVCPRAALSSASRAPPRRRMPSTGPPSRWMGKRVSRGIRSRLDRGVRPAARVTTVLRTARPRPSRLSRGSNDAARPRAISARRRFDGVVRNHATFEAV